ncbi:MAG: sensor histidine kinase [Actinomycetota bacterium]|nr:sensor histidine kinase [Actinomycetota bacterium]
MSVRHLRLHRLPASLFGATLVLEVAAFVLSWGLEPRYDTALYALYTVSLAGAGALIASRHANNPIGWLFCASAVWNAVSADLAQGWGLRAAESGWPGGTLGEWMPLWSWIPGGLVMVLTFLLFPDGRTLAPAWRAVAWVNVLGVLLATPGWALSTALGPDFVGGTNPYAVDSGLTDALRAVGTTLFLGSVLVSVVPLALRFRSARGVQRQQLKWFAFAGVCAVVILSSAPILWNVTPIVRPLVALALTALPVAACIAILRYRLYDIDVVINRTVVYTVITAMLAAAYAASALVIGVAVGRNSAWVTAGATLVVAVAFRPLRDRVQTSVDRRFSRDRYEAAQRVAAFLEDLRGGRAAPEAIEDVLREASGVERLELRFVLPGSERYVDIHGLPVNDDDGWVRLPIRRGGATLGTVAIRGAEEAQRVLLPKLIEVGGLAIEIARLQVELRRQLDEVEASRARMVVVADDERRRIERDLHDGAQQRLVSIGLALRHAQHALGSAAPEASRAIDGAVAEIAVAIDELRELARGLRPAHLDAGLEPALRELARRAPLPVEVRATLDRFTPDVETAAYFTVCEGLTNVVKHARASRVLVAAERQDDMLVISVADDGVGRARARIGSGLIGLSDRVTAQGGTLTIDSDEGHGTILVAEFPCAS